MTTVLVSCCSRKNNMVGTPEEVYCSQLFKLSMKYAKLLEPDNILILSAKYGVLGLNDIIEPYDLSLTTMSKSEREEWYSKVMKQLDTSEKYIVLAGKTYYEGLSINMKLPLRGLGIGQRIKRLNDLCNFIQRTRVPLIQIIGK